MAKVVSWLAVAPSTSPSIALVTESPERAKQAPEKVLVGLLGREPVHGTLEAAHRAVDVASAHRRCALRTSGDGARAWITKVRRDHDCLLARWCLRP